MPPDTELIPVLVVPVVMVVRRLDHVPLELVTVVRVAHDELDVAVEVDPHALRPFMPPEPEDDRPRPVCGEHAALRHFLINVVLHRYAHPTKGLNVPHPHVTCVKDA